MKSVDLSSYQNEAYKPGNVFKRFLWFFVSPIVFQSYLLPFSGMKRFILRCFGAKIGKGVVLKPNVHIKYPWFLSIGSYTWIGEKVWIDNLVPVTIGSNVCLSQGAMLLTGNHNYKSTDFDLITGEIYIEDGAWIGARALVAPGVRCHSHAVLSVMSAALSDLEPYTIYRGNPAEPVRKRTLE
jgi:putative colanic acid biosynthesis acetyltransferase WcaF